MFVVGKKYKSTHGLWELLAKSKPDKNVVTLQTDRHIDRYYSSLKRIELIIFLQVGSEQIQDLIYRVYVATLYGSSSTLGIVTMMSLGKVYYDPKHAAGFGLEEKLVKASKHKKRDVEEWLAGQNTYTLHKPVRKMFPRNPYTVTYIHYVWEMDLADLSPLSKCKDKYKYLLNVIDISSR